VGLRLAKSVMLQIHPPNLPWKQVPLARASSYTLQFWPAGVSSEGFEHCQRDEHRTLRSARRRFVEDGSGGP